VTTVALLVMIYSHGYMAHDKGYVRFFTYLAIFSSTGAAAVIDARRFFECFESAKATGGTDRLQNEPRGNLS